MTTFPNAPRLRKGALIRIDPFSLRRRLDMVQGGEIAGLDGGTLSVVPGTNAQMIGAKIARAVYGGLER